MTDSDWDHALLRGARLGTVARQDLGMTTSGLVRTQRADGDIYVMRASADLDLDAELICDWREGDLW